MGTSIAEAFIAQSANVTWFGHTFNIYAIIVLVIFALILWGLRKATKDDRIDWVDTITSVNQVTGRVEASITKILQIVGGITGTFCVVKQTLMGSLTWDIFAIYLAYVASVDGFTRFLLAKYGVTNFTPSNAAPTNATGSVKPKDDGKD